MKEIWKIIEEHPNYMVSNLGKVKNCKTKIVLRNSPNKNYLHVSLGEGINYKRYSVHRLVALAFVPGYFYGAVVNHKNGIKSDNIWNNLEWVTQKENMQHAVSSGLLLRRFRIIETGDIFQRPSSCALHIGGKPSSILKCLNGERQTHRGYHFEYIN